MAKVLLVEDDDLLRELYDLKLHQEGFDVVTATNGLEGLNEALSFKPDIILLDMMMPTMTGLEFLAAYRTKTSEPGTVLVLSNKSTTEDVKTAKVLGATDYLVKSRFTPDGIIAEIRKYLPRASV